MSETPASSRVPKPASEPYRTAARRARYVKAIIQMVIGTVAAVAAIVVVLRDWGSDIALKMMQEHVFSTIGVGLAVAAAVELAYTLFTDGPDEALDPLMLGLSAALILQLGHADRFAWTEGLAAILYVGALAGLFVVRRRLADVQEPDDYEPSFVKAWREWKSKA